MAILILMAQVQKENDFTFKLNLEAMAANSEQLSLLLMIYRHKIESEKRKHRFHKRLKERGFYTPQYKGNPDEYIKILNEVREEVFGNSTEEKL